MFGPRCVWIGIFVAALTHAFCPKPKLPEIDPRPGCEWKIRKDKYGCDQYKEVCEPTLPTSKICLMEKNPGRCRGQMIRFYYDEKSGTCEEFIYGGCGGNRNNFETLKQCREACGLASHSKIYAMAANMTSEIEEDQERKKRDAMSEKCPENELWQTYCACEPTCEHPLPRDCLAICKLNTCQCRDGTVRHEGRCIQEDKCPKNENLGNF